MPRYLVQRSFADGLRIPTDEQGAKVCLALFDLLYQGCDLS